MLNGREHNVANSVPSVAARGRYPAHRFAIAAVPREGDPQWLAVLTPELEAIGAPALVASRHGNPAVMSARNGGASRSALQQQAVNAHDPVDAFHVHRLSAARLSLAANQPPNAPVAVARQIGDGMLDFRHQLRVVCLHGTAPILPVGRACALHRDVRARYTEDITDLLHRSSPSNDGERAIHFFARPYSTASFRISTSTVFLPSSRCSSRICLSASASS